MKFHRKFNCHLLLVDFLSRKMLVQCMKLQRQSHASKLNKRVRIFVVNNWVRPTRMNRNTQFIIHASEKATKKINCWISRRSNGNQSEKWPKQMTTLFAFWKRPATNQHSLATMFTSSFVCLFYCYVTVWPRFAHLLSSNEREKCVLGSTHGVMMVATKHFLLSQTIQSHLTSVNFRNAFGYEFISLMSQMANGIYDYDTQNCI